MKDFLIPLTDFEQLTDIINQSKSEEIKPFFIFKHSTRCSISAMALSRIERGWQAKLPDQPVYYLDLITYRSLSDQIARQFNVQHESPQLLMIKNGQCVYYASHNAIHPEDAANAAYAI
jgi:bacillithiol system protein YtxJ